MRFVPGGGTTGRSGILALLLLAGCGDGDTGSPENTSSLPEPAHTVSRSPSPTLPPRTMASEGWETLSAAPTGDTAYGSNSLCDIGDTTDSGTSAMLTKLMDSYAAMPDGREKTDLAEQLANQPVRHEDLHVLFDTLQQDDQESVAVAQQMLAAMPDSPAMLGSLVRRYHETEVVEERIALAEVCCYLENPAAVPALADIVRTTPSLADPLGLAAVHALGTIGTEDARNTLLHELNGERTQRDQDEILKSLHSNTLSLKAPLSKQ